MLLKLTVEQLRENRINLLSQKERMKSVTAELTLSRKTVLVSEIAERNFVQRSSPQEQNTPKNSAMQALPEQTQNPQQTKSGMAPVDKETLGKWSFATCLDTR